MSSTNFGWLAALLRSRKFWLALITAIGAVILYVQGSITADILADALVALGVAVIIAIGIEDAGEKLGRGR